jgi:hypothetical protein
MSEYKVLFGNVVIGYSSFESGDPPMGVVFGKFTPLPAYEDVRTQCIALREMSQECLPLSVVQPNGQPLPATLGVSILDYSNELGPTEIEVHALGIGYPLYEQLFPNQVAAYANQIKGRRDD